MVSCLEMNLPFCSVTPTKVLTFMVSSPCFWLHVSQMVCYVPVYNVALHVRVFQYVEAHSSLQLTRYSLYRTNAIHKFRHTVAKTFNIHKLKIHVYLFRLGKAWRYKPVVLFLHINHKWNAITSHYHLEQVYSWTCASLVDCCIFHNSSGNFKKFGNQNVPPWTLCTEHFSNDTKCKPHFC